MFQRSLFIALYIYIILIELSVEETDKSNDWSAHDFETYLKEKNVIVEFYTTICVSCKHLYSILWKLMGNLDIATMNLAIGAVNCSKYESFCISKNVTTYPILLYFENNTRAPKMSHNLSTYVSEKNLEIKGSLTKDDTTKVCNSGEVFTLTDKNFASSTEKIHHFVKFFQPSCPFCVIIRQTWVKLASEVQSEQVCISEFDCTVSKVICQKYHIKAVPKLVWLGMGQGARVYNGGGQLKLMKKFVIDMVKTNGTWSSRKPSTATRNPFYPLRIVVYVGMLEFIKNYLFS